jgi:hypothetical protein
MKKTFISSIYFTIIIIIPFFTIKSTHDIASGFDLLMIFKHLIAVVFLIGAIRFHYKEINPSLFVKKNTSKSKINEHDSSL